MCALIVGFLTVCCLVQFPGWEDQFTANWMFQANNKQRISVPISPYTMLRWCQRRIHYHLALCAQFRTGLRPCKIRSYTAVSHLVLKSWCP